MKIKRKIIEIDEGRCSGCGECASACAEGAIRIVEGKARLVSETFCDGLGACLGECPEGALTITERESEEFDPAAVEEHLNTEDAGPLHQEPAMACGCPSHHIEVFPSSLLAGSQTRTHGKEEVPSALTHWPVQIRLIPPSAPFLKHAGPAHRRRLYAPRLRGIPSGPVARQGGDARLSQVRRPGGIRAEVH